MAMMEQDRAKFALGKVKAVEGRTDGGKYKTELKNLPARLHTGGLAQTMATYLADGPESVRAQIYTWVQDWLRQPPVGYPGGATLLEAISGAVPLGGLDAEIKYREASVEARALAVWLKKFAEAFL